MCLQRVQYCPVLTICNMTCPFSTPCLRFAYSCLVTVDVHVAVWWSRGMYVHTHTHMCLLLTHELCVVYCCLLSTCLLCVCVCVCVCVCARSDFTPLFFFSFKMQHFRATLMCRPLPLNVSLFIHCTKHYYCCYGNYHSLYIYVMYNVIHSQQCTVLVYYCTSVLLY